MSAKDQIWFGDLVKDRITGFKGVATSRHQFMYGCERWGVTPQKLAKEGKPEDFTAFDAPQLELLKKSVVSSPIPFDDGMSVAKPTRPGGPQNDKASVRRMPAR